MGYMNMMKNLRDFSTIESATKVGSLSRPTRQRMNIERNHEEGHVRIFNDYFSKSLVYKDQMQKHVFLHVVEALDQHDEYFRLVQSLGQVLHHTKMRCYYSYV